MAAAITATICASSLFASTTGAGTGSAFFIGASAFTAGSATFFFLLSNNIGTYFNKEIRKEINIKTTNTVPIPNPVFTSASEKVVISSIQSPHSKHLKSIYQMFTNVSAFNYVIYITSASGSFCTILQCFKFFCFFL